MLLLLAASAHKKRVSFRIQCPDESTGSDLIIDFA
jgi:hypothetical protein